DPISPAIFRSYDQIQAVLLLSSVCLAFFVSRPVKSPQLNFQSLPFSPTFHSSILSDNPTHHIHSSKGTLRSFLFLILYFYTPLIFCSIPSFLHYSYCHSYCLLLSPIHNAIATSHSYLLPTLSPRTARRCGLVSTR
ncbi:hypothetical protein B0T21DRAFT_447153, partial [Apiosordaria backusii]